MDIKELFEKMYAMNAPSWSLERDPDGSYKYHATQSAFVLFEQQQIEIESLKVQLEKAQVVPEGFVLVPKEPTEAMYIAGTDKRQSGGNTADVYKAMIEAQEPAPLKLGDLVEPIDHRYTLASGCERYPYAYVVNTNPFQLMSEEGDMYWCCTVEAGGYKLIKSNDQLPEAVSLRMIREGLLAPVEARESSPELKYPNIFRAAKEIWYDNGMINQFEPIEQKIEQLSVWLKTLDTNDLAEYNEKLNLTDDNLSEVCCSEETLAYEILPDEAVHDFLGRIFNEEYASEAQEQSHD